MAPRSLARGVSRGESAQCGVAPLNTRHTCESAVASGARSDTHVNRLSRPARSDSHVFRLAPPSPPSKVSIDLGATLHHDTTVIAWTAHHPGEQSVGVPASVRRLQPEDHELIRAIRLRSLTLEPAAFGSTLEREASFSDDDWRQRLAADASPHFVTTDESGAPTGLVVGAVDSEDPLLAHLFAMWVDPHARGSGAADALVGEVKRWAAAHGCAELQLRVTEGNTRAERMYLRHGFERTGQSWLRERDGHVELELVSRLERTASTE